MEKNGTSNWTRLDNLPSFPIPISSGDTIKVRKFAVSADSVGIYALVTTEFSDSSLSSTRYDLIRYIENQDKWIYKRNQPYGCLRLLVSGKDTNTIYYMDTDDVTINQKRGRNVSRSRNEGQTIVRQGIYRMGDPEFLFNGVSTHPDIRDLQLIPFGQGAVNDIVLAGTDGGILFSNQSTVNGDSLIWQNKNGMGLNITEFNGVASLKFGKEVVTLGAQDNGSYTLREEKWVNNIKGDGYDCTIINDSVIYTQYNFPNLYESSDWGLLSTNYFKWPEFSKNGNMDSPRWWQLNKRAINSDKQSRLYLGRYDLSITEDIWDTTFVISNFDSLNVRDKQVIVDISVYEVNSDIIFVAFPGYTDPITSPSRKIFRTTNGGDIWSDISNSDSIENFIGSHGIRSIIVDPTNANNVWITMDGLGGPSNSGVNGTRRVIRTQNALSTTPTWEDYSTGLPVFPVEEIIYEEGSNGRLYVATDVGVFYRDASMNQWECFTNGMPGVSVKDIDINYCLRKIYAATRGRGLWSADLPPQQYDSYVGSASGETWTNDTLIKNTIILNVGHKLTINNANVNMVAGTSIKVLPGAELVLNGANISNECGTFWNGIEVWNLDPTSQYCSSGSSCLTGKLTMFNSTIENAKDAVRLWKPNNWNMIGGMIYANNSTFLNNRRDVEFMAFENHYNSGSNAGNIAPYRSSFSKCNFVIDSNYLFDVQAPQQARVSMWKVSGVKFKGCSFANTSGRDLNIAGIGSLDANYTVKESFSLFPWNNITQSTFTNLKVGILANSTGQGYSFMVDTANFIDCQYGVVANGVNDAVISRNKFSGAGMGGVLTGAGAIFLNATPSFTVTQNKIENTITGISVRSSGGEPNEVYKNGFENTWFANRAYKDNNDPSKPWKGLQYKCNLYIAPSLYDVLIQGGSGIAVNQGTSTIAADNSFTSPINISVFPEQNIANDNANGSVINYYHHANASGYILDPTAIDSFKVVKFDIQTVFDPTENCLSSISHFMAEVRGKMNNQEVTSSWGDFNTAKTNYNQAKYVYASTIDGGDTYGLLNTVQTTNAQGAWDLRTDLINSSPLTDGLIMEVIDDDILSNSLLLDVLMVNPHASRNAEIINNLETKTTPMPAYMINTFLGLFGIESQKEVLESQIAGEAILMNKAKRFLSTHWKSDSTGASLDSIPFLLAQIPTPLADMQRVAYYRGMGNNEAANSVFDSIELKYNLTTWQQALKNDVGSLYTIYDDAYTNGDSGVMHLSAASENALEQLSLNDDTRAGVYAKGWLKYSRNELYLPEVVNYTPPAGKKGKQSIFELRKLDAQTIFNVYPNPAKKYITIESTNYEAKNGIRVEISNSVGQMIINESYISQGSHHVNLSTLSTGIYLLQILDGKKVIQKQIIEVVR